MKCCKRCRALELSDKSTIKINQATIKATSLKHDLCDKSRRVAKTIVTNALNEEYLFCCEAEMNHALKRLCYGNLYVIGKIWVEGLRTVLVGSKFCVTPTVKAAIPRNEQPKRPPPMKFSDLSLYNSPHYEYKECVRDNDNKCFDNESRTMHAYLYPIVKDNRMALSNLISEYYKKGENYISEATENIRCNKMDQFVAEARNPDNLLVRTGFVASSGLLGFIFGRRLRTNKDSIVRGLLVSSLATLAAGALCFPEETKEHFIAICYHSAKTGLGIYNIVAKDVIKIKEYSWSSEEITKKYSKPKQSSCPPTQCPPSKCTPN